MNSPYESRDGRRLSDDQGIPSRGEGASGSHGLVRRGTEPATRMSDESVPRYVAILLLGLSGVGKSTFISHLTHGGLKIGHSLTSCTTDVDGYLFTRSNGQQVYLLDSPGFDDTEKDNNRILRTIAMMLKTIHDSGVFILAGVLYLHRISDVRMAGSAIKSMRLIEKICGEKSFEAITIATTMWELVEPEIAEKREHSLISTPEYFGRLEAGGATVVRHLNTFASAVNIVEHILRKKQDAILDIQVEMAIERKSLDHTAAGQYLLGEFEQLRAKYERELEDLEEELEGAKDDDDLATMISEQRRENEENIRRVELSQQELLVTPEQMEQQQQEWFAERAAEAERLTLQSVEKTPREIELEEQLERTELDSIREMNKLRIKHKSTEKENQKLKKQIKERTRREQALKERAQREKEKYSFRNVLERGLAFLPNSSLRRATTELVMVSKSRRPKHHKDFLGHEQDAEEYEYSRVHAIEQSPAVQAAQHAVATHHAQSVSSSLSQHVVAIHGQPGDPNLSRQQSLPPGFEHPTYVDYAVDTRNYHSSQNRIALYRKYPPSGQPR